MKKVVIIAVIVIALIVIGVILYNKYGKKKEITETAGALPKGLTTAEKEEKFNLINEILEEGKKVPQFFEDTAESLDENTIAELKEILREVNVMVDIFV